jgi:glycosyltransferase involved in cell wall biosynthesis
MKIEWLISGISPQWVGENYQDGGYVYDTYARKILRSLYPLDVTYISRGNSQSKIKRFFEFGNYICKNKRIKFKGDIVIRDIFSTVFAPFDPMRKDLVILHHLDISSLSYAAFYRFFMKRLFQKIHLADRVIVVSEYWKNVLQKAGCSKIAVIYNAFDLNLFQFEQTELTQFKKVHGIPDGKPIIYLGNARLGKGYLESYEALKSFDATFVTTGENTCNLPIIHIYLSYPDYLKLLKTSTLVITMSKFNEGWCRTAHEAMLCGTPVVGSGRGGMKELLEKSGQVICEDFSKLNLMVRDLLSDSKRLEQIGLKGKEYASQSQFSLDYFRRSWSDLIVSLKGI